MKMMNFTNRMVVALTALVALTFTSLAPAQTYSVLKSFGILTNMTGTFPYSQLVQGADSTLYGTASSGAGNIRGTIFKIQPDGSGFTVLKWFTNSLEGAAPYAGLTLSGNTLYGTTSEGGSSDVGTVFKVNTDGTAYTVLKHCTVSDGTYPNAELTLSGGSLYGTTLEGGDNNLGTVFKVNTDGTGYTVLKHCTTSDGTYPDAALTLSGNALYGTMNAGGSNDLGTVFQVNTDGTGYTVLKHCTVGEGTYPVAALTLSGGILYGTMYTGGSNGLGTIFQMNTNGTGYTVLKHFGSSDGYFPTAGLTLSGSTIYGAAISGGSSGGGTVFKLNTNGTGYTVLKHFSDGERPFANLTLSGSTLYGTTAYGGSSGHGTVFKVNTDGTGFTVIKHFTRAGDAANPSPAMTLSGSTLYGTTQYGGSNNSGTVFQINIDGGGYTVLRHFSTLVNGNNGDGAEPSAKLLLFDSALYGTATKGGTSGNGTVFKINTNGGGYTVLKQFSAFISETNSDGANPYVYEGLALSGITLYGTTYNGGSSGNGTVFKVNTNGGSFTVLKHFSALDGSTNSDGANPYAGLALSGSTLYGTTSYYGPSGYGTVFKVNTNGSGFTMIRDFTGSPGDGAYPNAGLVMSGATLYGTTGGGGSSDSGTVFKINTNGTGYTLLKEFTGSPFDGEYPYAALVLSGSTLYGTTYSGGSSNSGTVFMLNTNGGGYTILKNFAESGANPGSLTLSGSALYGTTRTGGEFGLGTVFKFDLTPASPQPRFTSIAVSGTNAIISGTNGPINATYAVLTATNVASPLSNWVSVVTNQFNSSGNFSFTNGIAPGTVQRYFLLRTP